MRHEGFLLESTHGRRRILIEPSTPPVIIGRRPPYEPQNVRLPSVLVSRQHARVVATVDQVLVEDFQSTGGTFLDDAYLRAPTALRPGMRLKLNHEDVFTLRPFRGHSLYRLLCDARGPLLDGPGAGALIRELLRALAPLHAAGELHGSLDWHHVLREDGGGWVVVNHGWTVLDPEGTLSCNPSYCAPEVFAEHRLEPASDLYTVGLLAFEARCGRRPFDGPHVHAQMMAKLFGGAPEWPAEPRVSDAEQALYLHLLQLHPHQRPPIARLLEILDELWPSLGARS